MIKKKYLKYKIKYLNTKKIYGCGKKKYTKEEFEPIKDNHANP